MSVRVELFGIARQRAGRSLVEIALPRGQATLGEIFADLAGRLPQFGRECLPGGRLHGSLSANLDGRIFVSDPATPIRDGQSLLILSADAGG